MLSETDMFCVGNVSDENGRTKIMKKIQADIVVIGGGTAGMGAFRNARLHSDNVYLIENNVFGTTCARVGCMPSKLLIAAAEARHHALHTDPFGVHLDKDSIVVNGEEVMRRVKSERDRFVGFVVTDVEEWPADKRIMGSAKFIDEHTVQIDDHIQIAAKSFVIATGSRPVILPQWQSLGDRLIINDDVFSWDTLPKRVAVFGPGVIGLELGQALHRLGVKVEIFGLGGIIGGISDPVVSDEAKAVFGEELKLHLDAKTEVKLDADGNVEVHWEQDGEKGVFVAEYMLAAVGRRPNVDNIGLENINIDKDARGVPVADPLTMQTSIPHIFIAGDASNQLPLLHEAADQGKIAGDNAGRYPNIGSGLRRSTIGVVFTSPQIGFVGLKYAQVAAQYQADEFVIGEVSFKNQGRSRVMLVNKGHMRLYAEKATGRFIGAEIVGPAAEHLAHLLAWAHQMKMTVPQMLDMPFYHPVIEEGLRTALRDADAKLKA
ncbi:dihydrolipoamide dehydrogenase [Neisseria gonorrhoeae]|nr:dihydrolipoamide dehydrogenase [Neisseria gonorrhoeae NCCP11945]AKP10414.1 Dihydrolipoyl dehydrogenase [Neisseria gonorrhoeae]APW53072.1 dihydrolipoamide dehydrogenase [Neisseria gonorrhoeae NG-k51.05]EEZ45795.2 dihydrolipoamide dehydrogenase [Neisseria gonorrhoeae FA19]EEZ47640.2 dihydrolipoamide dehydrogenase [Neisseria gonorrhoeae MS11]EFE04434.1 dihydrolipoamide dehydrogenase [Neisseria gonorrhoeae DGI2]EFF39705.1 dihydrolipoamide dehydrogenase [Neisseria gonorrhoeae F62]KLR92691.1 di